MVVVLSADAGGSASAGEFLLIWVVIGVIAQVVLQPFARRIGGNQAADGGPGGSEKAIVGVIWFLAAISTGIYMAH
jgi:hypothetical protein